MADAGEPKADGYAAHLFHFTAAKAGMNNVDREKINKVIYESSKNSKFFQNEQRRDELTNIKIAQLRTEIAHASPAEIAALQRKAEKYMKDEAQAEDRSRIWAVVDMDMFYAAVEMRDNPDLRGKPVAVGGIKMICTANYEARKYGVRAAMPGFIATRLCPNLVFVPTNFDKYRQVAEQTREIFRQYDPNFEAMSLDEAYLDLTDYMQQHPQHTPSEVVAELRSRIFQITQLTASAGIACNSKLAKICSDVNKPNGQFELKSDEESIRKFFDQLPVRKIPGVGRVCEKMLNEFNLKTCSALREQAGLVLRLFHDSTWTFLLRSALGCGRTVHEEDTVAAGKKSMSCDRTFHEPLSALSALKEKLLQIAQNLADECKETGLQAKNISIKIKYASFLVKQKSITLLKYISDESDIFKHGLQLLREFSDPDNPNLFEPIRLLGLRLSSFKQNQFEKPSKGQSLMSNFFSSSSPASTSSMAAKSSLKSEPESSIILPSKSDSITSAQDSSALDHPEIINLLDESTADEDGDDEREFLSQEFPELGNADRHFDWHHENHLDHVNHSYQCESRETSVPLLQPASSSSSIPAAISSSSSISVPSLTQAAKRLSAQSYAPISIDDNADHSNQDNQVPNSACCLRSSSSSSSTAKSFECPVCARSLVCVNNTQMNAHIDSCLSKHRPESSSSSATTSLSSKKRKDLDTQSSSILKFLDSKPAKRK